MNKVKLITIFASIAIVTNSCTDVNRYFGLSDDNIFEESIEKVIEAETGLDIDLTP